MNGSLRSKLLNSQRWDVLGFGIVAVDDLLMVESYPPPDAKTAVLEKSRQVGAWKI